MRWCVCVCVCVGGRMGRSTCVSFTVLRDCDYDYSLQIYARKCRERETHTQRERERERSHVREIGSQFCRSRWSWLLHKIMLHTAEHMHKEIGYVRACFWDGGAVCGAVCDKHNAAYGRMHAWADRMCASLLLRWWSVCDGVCMVMAHANCLFMKVKGMSYPWCWMCIVCKHEDKSVWNESRRHELYLMLNFVTYAS